MSVRFRRPDSRSQSSTDGRSMERAANHGNNRRTASMPSIHSSDIQGILKVPTFDESIQSTYGSNSDDKPKRNIVFQNIFIREYARTIGDNPSCSSGPPVSISWEYAPETQVLTVDQYENNRPQRRNNFEMILPRDLRQQMLRKEWDVTQTQIASAVRANIRIKNQRRATVNNLGKATRLEELVEGAAKKFLKTVGLRQSTRKQVQELQEKMAAIEQARMKAKSVMQTSDDNAETLKLDDDDKE